MIFASGDVTEDPTFPKGLWPSRLSCPTCRPLSPWTVPYYRQHQLKAFHGHIWNMTATAAHIQRVYGNPIPNGRDSTYEMENKPWKLLAQSSAAGTNSNRERSNNQTNDNDGTFVQ